MCVLIFFTIVVRDTSHRTKNCARNRLVRTYVFMFFFLMAGTLIIYH